MQNSKKFISQLVQLYEAEQDIAEQVKSVKDEIKDQKLDPAIISAVAKAIVKDKVDELREKSNLILDTIQVSRS